MRTLEKNKSTFWFAAYQVHVPLTDANGHRTGEYGSVYGNPVQAKANISPAKGEASTREFGELDDYDRTLVLTSTGMNEQSVLWIGVTPQLAQNGSLAVDEDGNVITPHNYIVRRIAESLNSVTVAVKKVEVSG